MMRLAGIILHQTSCSSRNHVSKSWVLDLALAS